MATVSISYSIAHSSPHSGPYAPENILYDDPGNSSSRWSGTYRGSGQQWITLRLECPSVLKSITLGKFKNHHPCNVREFTVFVGMAEEHMTQALSTQLKNDTTPETFSLRHTNNAGVCFPVRYVKIIPLSAHGPSFNMSIWHVALAGIKDENYVQSISSTYDQYRERTVLRHILKHLRQRRLLTPYHTILTRSSLEAEHPLLNELHTKLVLEGDWAASEKLLYNMAEEKLFDDFLRASSPSALWTRVHDVESSPTGRSGHAMCIDIHKRVIYLHGGWDGRKCLDDFWSYDIPTDKWTLISRSTAADKNGPVPRSCHKMVFDSHSGCIYLLGRLGDGPTSIVPSPEDTPVQRVAANGGDAAAAGHTHPVDSTSPCSEFYRYHTRGLDAGTWDLLTFDTGTLGGPPLMFDSQMVMDEASQIIYVIGGRTIHEKDHQYADIYSYDVRSSKWKQLQPDGLSPGHRSGHSAVFDPSLGEIFIFSGQRDEKYFQDMLSYDVRSNSTRELQSGLSEDPSREATFGQKTVIDSKIKEIYTFGGLIRADEGPANKLDPTKVLLDPNCWVYRYDVTPGRWIQTIAHRTSNLRGKAEEPRARFAHESVFDVESKTMYMFGGNPGDFQPRSRTSATVTENGRGPQAADKNSEEPVKSLRLDDFWKMTLVRPTVEEVIRKATYQIRCQQFREMCEGEDSIKALTFLQTQVSNVVDHSNPEEAKSFRSLLIHLLDSPASLMEIDDDDDARMTRPSSQSSEGWTDKLEEGRPQLEALRSIEDPIENTSGLSVERRDLAADRYGQRSDVFERLLEFVDQSMKEPSRNLLDLVDMGEGGL